MTYTPPQPTPIPTPPGPPIRPVPIYPALFNDKAIQGNVLAAFNKDFELFMFLQVPDQAHGQAFLTDILPLVSTNSDVATFNQAFSRARRASGEDPDDLSATWLSLSLTIHGLELISPATSQVLTEGSGTPPSSAS